MSRSWALNAILAIAVVALASFAYLKPRGDAPVSYALSALKTDQVNQIRLERGNRPAIVLEKKGGAWRITAPFAAPAEPFQVRRVLAILDAKTAHRLAATELARFDLDQPQARLTVNGQAFSLGAVSTVTHEQYVLTDGMVYAIEPRYGAALPVNAAQLVRKQLFAEDEVAVRFEFRDFTVTHSDGRWQIWPPPGDLSQDDVNRWVDAWREAAALRAEPCAGGKPAGEIGIEFRDGRKIVLGILQREPEFVVARPDLNLQYYFPSETAKRLLAPPGEKPASDKHR